MLTQDDVSIGREPSSGLCIDDRSVSRRHCVIRRDGEQFTICDLQSRNGTFVNSRPVHERLLKHGDEVQIGDSLFVFLITEDDMTADDMTPAASSVQLDDRLVTFTSVRLHLRNEGDLHTETDSAAPRTARDLSALLKISTEINSISSQEALQQRLLQLIFEVIPSERGSILLVGKENPHEFTSTMGCDRRLRPGQPIPVSSTVIHQVLRERVAILSNHVLESDCFSAASSLMSSQIRSLLAVPVLARNQLLGVIYQDTSDAAVRFDEGHLELLTAIAGIAALALENSRHVEWLENENRRLQEDIDIEHSMIGESQRMREVYQFVARAAPASSTVLICGESGTGKELVARAIHQNSPRANKPFIAINCAALMESLLESELFGHEKGAFTGAIAQKKGKLEIADGGTVFLDEVAELAPGLQAKLLRALQERQFERVGGTRPLKVDIRLVAATNKDLEEAVRKGSFRQDLYYRLNVVSLTMPPLRERREDIPLLASYFTLKYSRDSGCRLKGISPEARACLSHYDWPGNVRELQNAIERAVVLGTTEFIVCEDLPEALLERQPAAGASIAEYHQAVKQAKRQIVQKAMEQAKGNYTQAAKLLGLHPNNLHRLIRDLDLRATVKVDGSIRP